MASSGARSPSSAKAMLSLPPLSILIRTSTNSQGWRENEVRSPEASGPACVTDSKSRDLWSNSSWTPQRGGRHAEQILRGKLSVGRQVDLKPLPAPCHGKTMLTLPLGSNSRQSPKGDEGSHLQKRPPCHPLRWATPTCFIRSFPGALLAFPNPGFANEKYPPLVPHCQDPPSEAGATGACCQGLVRGLTTTPCPAGAPLERPALGRPLICPSLAGPVLCRG